MATRDSDILDEIDENFLSCPICSCRYHSAKILPCLHSYCEKCLVTYVDVNKKLECPVCRMSVRLPEGGVSALTNSFFINNLVEQLAKRIKGEEGACDGCSEETAKNRCIDCAINLCQSCTKPHSNMPITRGHRVMQLEEYKKDQATDGVDGGQSPIFCTVHSGYKLKFYCKSCKVPICAECSILIHKGAKHAVKELSVAKEEFVEDIKAQLKMLKVKDVKVKYIGQQMEKFLEDLQHQRSEQEEKINARCKEIIKGVEGEQKRLLQQLQDSYETEAGQTQVKRESLAKSAEDIKCTLDYIDRLIQYGSPAQVLSMHDEITTCLEALLRLDTTIVERRPLEFKENKGFATGNLGHLHKGGGDCQCSGNAEADRNANIKTGWLPNFGSFVPRWSSK
ncbi:E3 ubiquitin-protein ligase TRIM56-like [Ptychodera flava]|uniref:E3 ubiquitin-protein ligase TRIM56-like n=1 Tax=Ptychodera flava TaxID=63121 RepID=UPI00396A659F